MSRLIDADALRQKFIERIHPLLGKDGSNERHEYISWLRSLHLLDDAPTTNNIIRCKDCKYWDYDVDNDVGFCTRTEDCDWNADDFCSRGEKR